jgi:SAM-dependent methyltransferase
MYDYSYTSSNSEYARSHWNTFAEETLTSSAADTKVLEIGSNDGFLLGCFLARGCRVLGFDSSESMCKIANDNGIPTINSIFGLEEARRLMKSESSFDLIIANNVLNHANNPLDFLHGVEKLLANDGRFVFEVPYWLSSVQTGNFDQIYHEHISYFTISSLSKIIQLTNLTISDIQLNEYHGGSLRVTLVRGGKNHEHKWSDLMEAELNASLENLETYRVFMTEVRKKRSKLLSRIHQIVLTEPNALIILAGAAAKANTFINYYKLDSTLIHCITDNSPHKIGKYTPLSRIPIVEDQSLTGLENIYVLTTAWNIVDIIKDRIAKSNPTAKVLSHE